MDILALNVNRCEETYRLHYILDKFGENLSVLLQWDMVLVGARKVITFKYPSPHNRDPGKDIWSKAVTYPVCLVSIHVHGLMDSFEHFCIYFGTNVEIECGEFLGLCNGDRWAACQLGYPYVKINIHQMGLSTRKMSYGVQTIYMYSIQGWQIFMAVIQHLI